MKSEATWVMVCAILLTGIGLACTTMCEAQQPAEGTAQSPVSYEEYLNRGVTDTQSTVFPHDPTWTVEPGREDSTQPSKRIRPSREQPDDPELDHRLSTPGPRDPDTGDEIASDLGSYLRTKPTSTPPVRSTTGAQRLSTILSTAIVAMLGALIGVGVLLIRQKYGQSPDPPRRSRRIR
jgi:hypothetical protein